MEKYLISIFLLRHVLSDDSARSEKPVARTSLSSYLVDTIDIPPYDGISLRRNY